MLEHGKKMKHKSLHFVGSILYKMHLTSIKSSNLSQNLVTEFSWLYCTHFSLHTFFILIQGDMSLYDFGMKPFYLMKSMNYFGVNKVSQFSEDIGSLH